MLLNKESNSELNCQYEKQIKIIIFVKTIKSVY